MAGAKVEIDIEDASMIVPRPHLRIKEVKVIVDADNLKEIDDHLFKVNAQAIIDGETHQLIISRKKGNKGWTTYVESSSGQMINIKSDKKKYLDFEFTDGVLGSYKFSGEMVAENEAKADIIVGGRLYKMTADWNKNSSCHSSSINVAIKDLRGNDAFKIAVKKEVSSVLLYVRTSLIPDLEYVLKANLVKQTAGELALNYKILANNMEQFDFELASQFPEPNKLVISAKHFTKALTWERIQVVLKIDLTKGVSVLVSINEENILDLTLDYTIQNQKFEFSLSLATTDDKRYGWTKKEFVTAVTFPRKGNLQGKFLSYFKKDGDIVFELDVDTIEAPYKATFTDTDDDDLQNVEFAVDEVKTNSSVTKLILTSEILPEIVLEIENDGNTVVTVGEDLMAINCVWASETNYHYSVLLPFLSDVNVTIDVGKSSFDFFFYLDANSYIKSNHAWGNASGGVYEWRFDGKGDNQTTQIEEKLSWRDADNLVYSNKEKTVVGTYIMNKEYNIDFNTRTWVFNDANIAWRFDDVGVTYTKADGFNLSLGRFQPSNNRSFRTGSFFRTEG